MQEDAMDYWIDMYNDDKIDIRTLEYAMDNEIDPDSTFNLDDPEAIDLLNASIVELDDCWEDYRYYLIPLGQTLYRCQGQNSWYYHEGEWCEAETTEEDLQDRKCQIDSVTALNIFRGEDQ